MQLIGKRTTFASFTRTKMFRLTNIDSGDVNLIKMLSFGEDGKVYGACQRLNRLYESDK